MKFTRIPADYRNLLVGLVALLVILLLWGAQTAVRSHAPQAQAQAQAVQAQTQEFALRRAAERETVLQARNAARAQWQARVEAARALAQIGGYLLLTLLGTCLVLCLAIVAGSVALHQVRVAVQLPPVRRLPRGAVLLPWGVQDTETGAAWLPGVPRDPQLEQAQALALALQARGMPRREALPLAWQVVEHEPGN